MWIHLRFHFATGDWLKKKKLLWITWPPLSYLMSDEGKNIITPCWLDLDCLAPSDNMLLWLSETSCHLDWKIRMTLNINVLWKQREVTSPYTLKDKTGCLTLVSKSSIYSSGSSKTISSISTFQLSIHSKTCQKLVIYKYDPHNCYLICHCCR